MKRNDSLIRCERCRVQILAALYDGVSSLKGECQGLYIAVLSESLLLILAHSLISIDL